MSNSQERPKSFAVKIADGGTEQLSNSDITKIQPLLSNLSLLDSPINPTSQYEPRVNNPRLFTGVNVDNQSSTV